MKKIIPDSTASRVAMWRAMHMDIDGQPFILEDRIGLELVNPPEGWRDRPDMHPLGTAPFRASIVGRARFIEDFVKEEMKNGINQYVVLGAGLDTFTQRNPNLGVALTIYEIDQPDTVAWKKTRLVECGYPIPHWLKLISVDFESGVSWWEELKKAGFDSNKKAVVTSIGVSMYLTMDVIRKTLNDMKRLAPGSKFIMTFMLPLDQVNPEDKTGYERSLKGAQASGTPFISFFKPEEMLKLAGGIGFTKVEHLSTKDLIPKYFADRTDGLKPSSGEEFLIVTI